MEAMNVNMAALQRNLERRSTSKPHRYGAMKIDPILNPVTVAQKKNV
jgi:hypothetical protein